MVVYHDYDALMAQVCLPELVECMDLALRQKMDTQCEIPQRSMIYRDDGRSAYFSMPAFSADMQLFISKVATFKARSASDDFPSIHSVLVAFESETGKLSALLDGTAITNIKCAALSALVTRYCSLNTSHHLALLGSGVQARQQLWALSSIRTIEKLSIWSRSRNNALQLAREAAEIWLPNCKIEVLDDPEDALCQASLIATTTASCRPIAQFESLVPGVHINCMGAHTPESREIPRDVLQRSVLIVENQATACAEAGEWHRQAIEIGPLVNGPSRSDDTTIFSSTGYAFYDLVTACYLLNKLK
ncbi:ornithine cyclodeaminase family protein [Pseudomonas mosselii]|uniref:ornithine cyclodeaminase family protein n=1 Tax=Pseudomonas mosselii TaxID=78327 RepID=UPI000782F5FA|nr:ornithine cyclodeaminase family protein [Pseudomonas mosselii]MEA3234656.1 hypothetical protein [Pseudomonas mosselii]UWS65785.1 hypothetical protein N0U38_18635 [Pseudomonas mosselii]